MQFSNYFSFACPAYAETASCRQAKSKVTKEKGSTKKGVSTRATASITHSRKSRAFRARPTALGTIVELKSPKEYSKTE